MADTRRSEGRPCSWIVRRTSCSGQFGDRIIATQTSCTAAGDIIAGARSLPLSHCRDDLTLRECVGSMLCVRRTDLVATAIGAGSAAVPSNLPAEPTGRVDFRRDTLLCGRPVYCRSRHRYRRVADRGRSTAMASAGGNYAEHSSHRNSSWYGRPLLVAKAPAGATCFRRHNSDPVFDSRNAGGRSGCCLHLGNSHVLHPSNPSSVCRACPTRARSFYATGNGP